MNDEADTTRGTDVFERGLQNNEGILSHQQLFDSAQRFVVQFENFNKFPLSLREYVSRRVVAAYKVVPGLQFEFLPSSKPSTMSIYLSDEIPHTSIFGENSIQVYSEGKELYSSIEIYLGLMRSMAVQLPQGGCRTVVGESSETLGVMLVNTIVHEIGHGLGLEQNSLANSAHVEDPKNYMWGGLGLDTKVRVDYTVKADDSLASIVQRWNTPGELHPCALAPNSVSTDQVWNDEQNRQAGYIADPDKGRASAKTANNADYIYPGERVSLRQFNFVKPTWLDFLYLFVGERTFTKRQISVMNQFVREQLRNRE